MIRRAAIFVGFSLSVWPQVGVYTGQYNLSRTNANQAETILTTSNVNSKSFGLLFSRTVDGQLYAQPLYAPGVTINGKTQNVVYAATMNNTVYAFDADNPAASAPLWSVNLGAALPFNQDKLAPQVGVLGTPVIDPSSKTIYVVAATLESNLPVYRLHALDLTSGSEKFSGPVIIAATAAGSAPDSTHGIVTFNPGLVLQRAAVALIGGVVHISFGASQEGAGAPIYHGWLIGYNAATLVQSYAITTTANGSGGGIWMSGVGPAADSTGMFLTIGNGSTGSGNLSEAVLHATSAGDYFVPDNFSTLNSFDWDFGTTGPLMIPGTSLLAVSGKTGMLFLLNRTGLGHYATGNTGAVQSFQATPACSSMAYNGCYEIHHLTYWYRPASPSYLYLWGWNDSLKAYAFSNGLLNTTPASQNPFKPGFPGGILALSSSGSSAGTAIVWALTSTAPYTGDGPLVPAVLHAYDASNVSRELWNSTMNVSDAVGALAKFAVPVVTNGKVYVATGSNKLQVYGLH